VLSRMQEEREKRLESMFEAVQDDSKDESLQQTTEVGAKRTQESLTAADSIIEALDMAEEEIERMRLHKTESGNEKLVNFQPNVMMLQLSPSAYVLRTMVAVRPSDLEQALVVCLLLGARS
jgi:U3 small nucleolar RNA-associated protein 12